MFRQDEAEPASITQQIDAGLRYRLMTGVTFIAGVFGLKKPFFDRDTANVFREIGNVRHRGAELSLSGQVMPGLTVVAGAMLLQPRITILTASAGTFGRVPIARPGRNVRLTAQYGPKSWRGFSINGQINHEGLEYANRANTLRMPSLTTLDLGARYTFQIYGHTISARSQIQNVPNRYAWSVSPSGAFSANATRRVVATLVTDF